MDAVTPEDRLEIETRFLPAVAARVGQKMYSFLKNDPDDGTVRCVAVSDIDMTREYVLKLPLAVVAFIRSESDQLTRSNSPEFRVADTFVIDFWMEPVRIKKKGSQEETPYWSYYPYEMIRNRLINAFLGWTGPNGERVSYRGLHVSAEPQAARLTFTFLATFQWCSDDPIVMEDIVEKVDFRLREEVCVPEPVCKEDPCAN